MLMRSAKFNLKEGLEQRNRILLLMKYSLEKTLTENKKHLNEPLPMMSKADELQKAQEYPKELQKTKEQEEEEYRKQATAGCPYPDKAIVPPKTMAGDSGILQCCCYYPVPAVGTPNKGQVRGMYIPRDSKIEFWDELSDYERASNWYISQWKEKGYDINQDWTDEQVTETFPFGTVKRITNSDGTSYGGWVKRSPKPTNGIFEDFYFIGYFTDGKNPQPFPQEVIEDDRNAYQKFIDDWGSVIQWTTAIVTAVGAIFAAPFTYGGSLVLWAELGLELGVGLAVGIREIQKGNDIAGVWSIIFGTLPAYKYIPELKGVAGSTLDELSVAFANSGLSSKSTFSQYLKFYRNLNPEQRRALDLVIRGGDVQSATRIADDLYSTYAAGFANMWKKNPKLFKPIEVYDRLWARELSANLTTSLAAYLDNYLHPELSTINDPNLTNEMKDKLDGVFENVPETLKKQMGHLLLEDPDRAIDFLDSEEKEKVESIGMKAVDKNSDLVSDGLSRLWVESFKDFSKKTGKEFDLNVDEIFAGEKMTPTQMEELKKRGYIEMKDLDQNQKYDSLRYINNIYYVKPLNEKYYEEGNSTGNQKN